MSKAAILFVDNDPTILQTFQTTFNPFYNIVVAKDVQEGLKLVSQKKFDLVISDYNVSKVDGITLIKTIKSVLPKLKTMTLSPSVQAKKDKTKVVQLWDNELVKKDIDYALRA